jgi:octaprenyl-diphosphate synthase
VIEFIHTATLLHDDVVDESDLRRGRDRQCGVRQCRERAGRRLPVFARFSADGGTGTHAHHAVMADTTNQIAEGEVLQLMHIGNPDTDEAAYLRVIERKTAVLFAAATRVGAVLADAPSGRRGRAADYGMALGMAFQIADDVLDYVSMPTRWARTSATTSPRASRRCR